MKISAHGQGGNPSARRLKRMKHQLAHALIHACRLLPDSAIENAGRFGQSIEYASWIHHIFGPDVDFYSTHEALWRQIIFTLAPDTRLTVYEFGVAYGYASRWWLKHCPMITRWYGFDTFTGLPEAWRSYPAGAFSAGRKPPDIDDPRVEWIIGRAEDTVDAEQPQLDTHQKNDGSQAIYLFDMDLYTPTLHVVRQVLPHLTTGDILYFDEAADLDERRVLIEEMDRLIPACTIIGSTPLALALRRR